LLKTEAEDDEIGRASRINGEKNAFRLFVGNPEGKKPLGGTVSRWVDNIKMSLER
jgi:hypothetical protein